MTNYFYRYWFGEFPWTIAGVLEAINAGLCGNVKTPTMLMTGEVDYRTAVSEGEHSIKR